MCRICVKDFEMLLFEGKVFLGVVFACRFKFGMGKAARCAVSNRHCMKFGC